jgi:nitrogen fixation protein FixH
MREITGRKVAVFTVSAFAVVIGVNLLLAWKAVSTFPGLEVANSYVASQTWDAERAAQKALGWRLAADYDHVTDMLDLVFTDAQGGPAPVGMLRVLVGRPTEAKDDQWPVFARTGDAFRAPVALGPGKWMLKVEAEAPGGTVFRQRLDLLVKG